MKIMEIISYDFKFFDKIDNYIKKTWHSIHLLLSYHTIILCFLLKYQ